MTIEKTNPTIENLAFLGRKISELNKEELQEAILCLYEDYDRYKNLYFEVENKKVEMMGDMIKLKFGR